MPCLLCSFVVEHSENQYGTCEPRILHKEHTYRETYEIPKIFDRQD